MIASLARARFPQNCGSGEEGVRYSDSGGGKAYELLANAISRSHEHADSETVSLSARSREIMDAL